MRIHVSYAGIPGTRAGIARAGNTTVIADRPTGVAGGEGIGANGAQLLASAIGGCFWNDLQTIADRRGVSIGAAGVEVELDLDGDPPRVTAARLTASLATEAEPVFREAAAETIIGHSLMAAFPVTFRLEETPA